MKKALLVIFLLTYSGIFAEQSKTLERSFTVKAGQKIIIENLSGAKLLVKSWDKNEAYVKLRVKFSSSDNDFEKEYIKSLGLKESSDNTELRITYDETNDQGGGWSFLGIDLRFNYYQKKEITGEIYLPVKNNFQTNAKYGELNIQNLKGEVELYGRSNKLTIKNCPKLKAIDNDYGDTDLEACGGHLILKNRSNKTDIKNFNGSLKVEADYSNINIDDVSSRVIVDSRSGNDVITNVKGDLKINSQYSNITLENIGGFADVITRSGTVDINKAAGVSITGDYCNIKLKSINGKSDKTMKIKSRSGTLDIEDLSGNLYIDNPYSDMEFRQVKGNVELTGRSSTVRGNDITGNWKSHTEYMIVKIRNLSAKTIDITNRSNPVELDLRTIPVDVNIQNEYGGVKIDMPRGYTGDIDMNVKYGEIETNLPLKHKSLGSSAYAVGRIGTGPGKFYIETKSGNIEVFEEEGGSGNSQSNKNFKYQNISTDFNAPHEITVNSHRTVSFSAVYQTAKNGEYYGASFSKWLKTWNNEKVILRGTASYLLGNHWGQKASVRNYSRAEIGIDSRNSMVLGTNFFTMMNLSYIYTQSDIQQNNSTERVKDNGWMFALGFGTKMPVAPVVLSAKYVWGPENGIRLGLEFDF